MAYFFALTLIVSEVSIPPVTPDIKKSVKVKRVITWQEPLAGVEVLVRPIGIIPQKSHNCFAFAYVYSFPLSSLKLPTFVLVVMQDDINAATNIANTVCVNLIFKFFIFDVFCTYLLSCVFRLSLNYYRLI
jgi:hypothetical protein